MDRRSILFIVGMTVIFFLMNQWFDYGRPSQTGFIEPKTPIEFLADQPPTSLTGAQIKRMDIVSLYRDVQLQEFACFAVAQEELFLTIPPQSQQLPNTLYIRNLKLENPVVQRLERRAAPAWETGPALYSVYPTAKFMVPWIPEEGEYAVQMVFVEGGTLKTVEGTSYGVKRAVFDMRPPSDALVFIDLNQEIAPYGFFRAADQSLHYLNDIPQIEDFSLLTFPTKDLLKDIDSKEQLYVLQNDYFQLVFSSFNGAIAEINLPFHSDQHPNSVVRKIAFDRILESEYPDNSRFPQYPARIATGDGETKTLQPQVGGYYPLIRRDLIGSLVGATVKINPHYYTTAIVERDSFPFIQEYKVTRFEKNLIQFELSDDKRRITKTFKIPDDSRDAPYCIDLSVNIEGDARKLEIGSGIPSVELISGSFNPSLQYRSRRSAKPSVERIKIPKNVTQLPSIDADWYCNGNGFFGIIIDPLTREVPGLTAQVISGDRVPTRLSLIDAAYQRYPTDKYPGYEMHFPLIARPGKTDYRLFLGPFDKSILTRVDRTYTHPITGYNPHYSDAQSYHGFFAFVSQPFAKFLFVIMDFFYSITHSWGVAIILLTVALRLMLYPLNNWSMRSTAKLKKLAPKIKAIQDKYKNDPKRLQMEMMGVYRKEKTNPFGGCFPVLIQIPFIMGLLDLLKSSFELRGAPFIPGWIDNLTAPDVLFTWSYPIPFFGNAFHLLPLLLGVIMFVQQKVMSPGEAATDQQRQQRVFGNILAIGFTVMFYHFPSGLNLYWIFSMLLGILQQWYVNKKMGEAKG